MDKIAKYDEIFLLLGAYAQLSSGCVKVKVASLIETTSKYIVLGSNSTDSDLCFQTGCLRIQKFGDNTKSHRNPDDCRATHSEIEAIAIAGREGRCLKGATLYITRYPCEACARAIVRTGIVKVVYGRDQVISEMTKQIFEEFKTEIVHYTHYTEEDVML